jgi:hypothetical protein
MYIVDGEQMVRLLKLMTGLNVFCFVTRTIVSLKTLGSGRITIVALTGK